MPRGLTCSAIVNGDTRFGRRESYRHADELQRRLVGGVDAERLEQIGVADLQPGEPRIGARDLGGCPKSLGSFDSSQQPDLTIESASLFKAVERIGGCPDVR